MRLLQTSSLFLEYVGVNAGAVLGAVQAGIVDVSAREADLEDVFLSITRAAIAG